VLLVLLPTIPRRRLLQLLRQLLLMFLLLLSQSVFVMCLLWQRILFRF
jgi:hypothetical protein